jgi:tetratricopeptide (TPR) repeat protein
MKTFHTDVTVSTGNLFKLERRGRYEEALAELRHIWEDINSFPEVEDFAPRPAADIILRCGALIGFLGHIKQIPNSQERSKNLLTEARSRFFDIYDVEKIAECENYLALAYWRTGELTEAETWVEESLSKHIPDSSHIRLHSHIIKCLIYIPAKKHFEIISNLKNLENKYLSCDDNCLKGDFYNHYGLALKNIGKTSKALEKLEQSRNFYQKAKHLIYLGAVENNLSQLYKVEKRFAEAHKTIDNSTKTFKQIKDRTREGFSLDTKAQIFLAEGKYSEALRTLNEQSLF